MRAFLILVALGAGGYYLFRKSKELEGEVRAQRTTITLDDARRYFRDGFQQTFGRLPTPEEEGVLLAQSAHETARWVKMFNWNWAGLKAGQNQAYAELTTREGEGAFERAVTQKFAAYGNAVSGVKGWLGLLKRKYDNALAAASAGDPEGFARALKARGYFTGNADAYAHSLANLYPGFLPESSVLHDPVPNGTYSSTWGEPRGEGRTHQGVDIFAPEGSPVLAIESGTVSATSGENEGTGASLVTKDGTRYSYAHLRARTGTFPRAVRAGDQIGEIGTTGNAVGTPPHLHLEWRPNGGAPTDPAELLDKLRANA